MEAALRVATPTRDRNFLRLGRVRKRSRVDISGQQRSPTVQRAAGRWPSSSGSRDDAEGRFGLWSRRSRCGIAANPRTQPRRTALSGRWPWTSNHHAPSASNAASMLLIAAAVLDREFVQRIPQPLVVRLRVHVCMFAGRRRVRPDRRGETAAQATVDRCVPALSVLMGAMPALLTATARSSTACLNRVARRHRRHMAHMAPHHPSPGRRYRGRLLGPHRLTPRLGGGSDVQQPRRSAGRLALAIR
jgi:hypothetical protein